MRKITFLVLLAVAFYNLKAQFNLTDALMPQPGDQQFCQFVDTTGFDPGPAGTGQTWNFSSFPDSTDPFYLKAIDPATGPHAADFGSNSTVGIVDGAGNYTYFNHTTGSYVITGVNNSLTLNNSAKYTKQGLRYTLPTTFNTTYNDTIAGQYSAIAGLAYRTGTVSTTVDADGTLIVPDGTTHSNCIRVKHVATIRDSANFFGNIIISNSVTTYHEWYVNTQALPVMVSYRVTGTAVGNNINEFLVYYAIPDTSISRDEFNQNVSFEVSPNPFSTSARLSFTLQQSGDLSADLIDLSGRVVRKLAGGMYGAGNHDLIVDGESLKPGVYFVRMRSQGGQITRKLIHF
ncbi:MAG: T9SS type A sorting domain-containing protein [Bacteroidia bacterium]|nr:T9SS type A sorting domain-containing protein [Bacteroidia bacterium]